MQPLIRIKQKRLLHSALLGPLLFLTLCVLSACQPVQIVDWSSLSELWLSSRRELEPPVGITFMGWSAGDAADQRLLTLVSNFNAEWTNVQVSLQLVQNYDDVLRSTWIEDSPPDLFFIDSFQLPNFIHENRVSAISTLAAQQAQSLQTEAFYPLLVEAFTIDGTLYCLPGEFNTLALLYNKELFDKAQISYPISTWGWLELRTAAEAITKIPTTFFDVSGLAITADFSRWTPFLYQAGGSVMDETAATMTINTPVALEAMNFYLNLVLDGMSVEPQNISSSWSGEAFGKGKVGMIIEGNWVIPYLEQEFPDLNYGVAPLPAGPNGKATLAFSHCYAISSTTPNPDAALQLVLYLTSQDAMQFLGKEQSAIPARIALQSEWLNHHPGLEPFMDGIAYARTWRFTSNFQDVIVAINVSMQQVFDAEVTPEEVLRVADMVGTDVLSR